MSGRGIGRRLLVVIAVGAALIAIGTFVTDLFSMHEPERKGGRRDES